MSLRSHWRKVLSVLSLLGGLTPTLHAQIQPATSQYMFHPQLSNPAFYGQQEGIRFAAVYRHQWAKLEGQPQTLHAAADAYLPAIKGAAGLVVANDRLGAYNNTTLQAGYTYIQDIRKKVKIGIGLNAGMVFSKLDGTQLITPQGDESGLNDDALSNQLQKSIRPHFSVGVSVVHKWIEAGISYSNVLQSSDKLDGVNVSLRPVYGGVLQTYVSGKIKVSDDFTLKPSVLVYSDFKKVQTELSIMAGYKEYVYLGVNVRGYNKRSFESLSPIVAVMPVKNLSIIYNYDVSLNNLNAVNKGTHEISLSYLLPNKKIYKSPKIINNPRFL
jgi:type IX secretion system PorP/SprF family membrane protein